MTRSIPAIVFALIGGASLAFALAQNPQWRIDARAGEDVQLILCAPPADINDPHVIEYMRGSVVSSVLDVQANPVTNELALPLEIRCKANETVHVGRVTVCPPRQYETPLGACFTTLGPQPWLDVDFGSVQCKDAKRRAVR